MAADTVLVVKGARLDVTSHHHVERRVRWLVWVFYVQVVAAKAKLVLRITLALLNVLL